jgi:hypothetical protein
MKFAKFNKVVSLALLVFPFSNSVQASSSFDVQNNTSSKITAIYISHGDKTWNFDIGSGLPSGKTITLEWADWTDELPCELEIMADFADDSESEEAEFDFCEEGTVIVFE